MFNWSPTLSTRPQTINVTNTFAHQPLMVIIIIWIRSQGCGTRLRNKSKYQSDDETSKLDNAKAPDDCRQLTLCFSKHFICLTSAWLCQLFCHSCNFVTSCILCLTFLPSKVDCRTADLHFCTRELADRLYPGGFHTHNHQTVLDIHLKIKTKAPEKLQTGCIQDVKRGFQLPGYNTNRPWYSS